MVSLNVEVTARNVADAAIRYLTVINKKDVVDRYNFNQIHLFYLL